MGLFGKIKNAKNFITGGGAEVQVSVPQASRQQPFQVNVAAQVKDGEMKINKVYVKVRAVEKVTVRKVQTENGRRDVHESVETCNIQVDVAGAQFLSPEAPGQWAASVAIPQGSLPTFQGHNAEHKWQVCAFLDKSGNDPDSGWVDFYVQ